MQSVSEIRFAPRQVRSEAKTIKSLPEVRFAPKQSRGTVTRTIRIDREVEEKLLVLSEKERTSTNFIVNQALRRHVEWEAKAAQFGFLSVPYEIMAKMLDCLTEDQAKELGARSGENKLSEMASFWFKKVDLDSSLKVLDLLGSQHGKAFEFDRNFDGKTHTLILRHGMGPKASTYYSEALKGLFSRIGHRVETMITDDQVVARIQLRYDDVDSALPFSSSDKRNSQSV